MYDECCGYLPTIKGGEEFLSKLGLRLSAGARTYLKDKGLGLKAFLAQRPDTFSIKGGVGREKVILRPGKVVPWKDTWEVNTNACSDSRSRQNPAATTMDQSPKDPKTFW